jgi:hypothetical protein
MLRSIADYQQGHADEARRLALSVRMLVYDTTNQKSLLKYLGLKETMFFYDTASEYDPRQYGSHLALLAMLVPIPGQEGQTPRADARLDAQPTSPKDEMQPFDKWWSTLVIRDDEGNTHSRRDILLTVADKDGGAHVDLKISPAYMNLVSGGATRWQVTSDAGKSLLEGIELATVRQIAHEVLVSVARYRPDCFADHSVAHAYASETMSPSEGWGAHIVDPRPFTTKDDLGRNDPCWCDSGRKLKYCHGSPKAIARGKGGKSTWSWQASASAGPA